MYIIVNCIFKQGDNICTYGIILYMAKYNERIKAREMRKNGLSIILIAHRLGVTKSSVSLWCRDIILTHEQFVNFVKTVSRLENKIKLMGKRIQHLNIEAKKSHEENQLLKTKSLQLLSNYENDKKRLEEQSEEKTQKVMKKFISEIIGTVDIFEMALNVDPEQEDVKK